MKENSIFNDLETLNISLLLDSLSEVDRYHFVLKLLENAWYWVWKANDLFHSNYFQWCDEEEYDEEAVESYHRYFDEMDSLILDLIDVFGSIVRNLRINNYSEEGRIINIKALMELPPEDRIDIIKICLEYVDIGIKVDGKLEELKTTLIAIRDEDLKNIEEEKKL